MCFFSGGDMNIKQGIPPRVSPKYIPGPKVLGVGLDVPSDKQSQGIFI